MTVKIVTQIPSKSVSLNRETDANRFVGQSDPSQLNNFIYTVDAAYPRFNRSRLCRLSRYFIFHVSPLRYMAEAVFFFLEAVN